MTQNIEHRFKSGMRQLAGAVHIITTGNERTKHGLTATAVCSLTVKPPSLIACINKDVSAYHSIVKFGCFGVNVLTHDQTELAKLFSDSSAIERRFDMGTWTTLTTGVPILSGSLCSFDCRITDKIDHSTHTIFIAEVVDVLCDQHSKPLVYFNGNFTSIVGIK